MSGLARTPDPPYWAVIFTAQRSDEDDEGYGAMAAEMVRLASQQDGFLGIETVRDRRGLGITVSYWRDEQAIAAWHQHLRHREAQRGGRSSWYTGFELRVARVERASSFERG